MRRPCCSWYGHQPRLVGWAGGLLHPGAWWTAPVGEDGRGVSDGSSFSLFLLIFSTFLEHGFAFSFPVDSGHPVQRGPL